MSAVFSMEDEQQATIKKEYDISSAEKCSIAQLVHTFFNLLKSNNDDLWIAKNLGFESFVYFFSERCSEKNFKKRKYNASNVSEEDLKPIGLDGVPKNIAIKFIEDCYAVKQYGGDPVKAALMLWNKDYFVKDNVSDNEQLF